MGAEPAVTPTPSHRHQQPLLCQHTMLRRTRAIEGRWGNLRGPISIVPAVYLSQDGKEPSTGWGELRALAYILSILYAFYPPERIDIVVPRPGDDGVSWEELGDNVLVIGGPNTNAVAKEVLERSESVKIPFRFADFTLLVPEGYGTRRRYEASFRDPGDPFSILSDYGCIVYRNIREGQRLRRLWLFMGCHTYGTYAAAVAAFSDQLCAWLVRHQAAEEQYDFVTRVTQLENLRSQERDIEITIEASHGFPQVGPIYNRADIDSVISEVAFGVRYREEQTRKRIVAALLALSVSTLAYPYVLRFILRLFGL